MDMMGYILMRVKVSTFIIFKRSNDGGPLIKRNGAILTQTVSHPYLHVIELKDLDVYRYVNRILKAT